MANRFDDGWNGQAIGRDLGRIQIDLVLPDEAADTGHLGHAFHSAQPVPQVPILETAQGGQIMLAGLIDQGVLKDPAHTRRVWAELRGDAFRHASGELIQPLQDTGARPVDVGPVFEQDIDIGVAKVREATDDGDLGRGQQRRDDRIGDLIFNEIGRAARPGGIDNNLRVGNIRQRINRRLPHRP